MYNSSRSSVISCDADRRTLAVGLKRHPCNKHFPCRRRAVGHHFRRPDFDERHQGPALALRNPQIQIVNPDIAVVHNEEPFVEQNHALIWPQGKQPGHVSRSQVESRSRVWVSADALQKKAKAMALLRLTVNIHICEFMRSQPCRVVHAHSFNRTLAVPQQAHCMHMSITHLCAFVRLRSQATPMLGGQR